MLTQARAKEIWSRRGIQNEVCHAMTIVQSDYGYLLDFDGEDYQWTADVRRAWRMTLIDIQLATGRLQHVPKLRIVFTQ